jgi:hypothetical protein
VDAAGWTDFEAPDETAVYITLVIVVVVVYGI